MKILLISLIGFILIASLVWAEGAFEGTVYYGMTQNPAERATVKVVRTQFPPYEDETTTDESGEYFLPGLPNGSYQIWAEKMDGDPQWLSDTLLRTIDNDTVQVDLHMMEIE